MTMPTNDSKLCPFCGETIRAVAVKCRFCGEFLPSVGDAVPPAAPPAVPASDVLELLAGLVNKSLVLFEEDDVGIGRYRLAETVRQYARDRLWESGASEQARERHGQFFAAFAETAEPNLRGAEQTPWFGRLDAEHDNLRAALEWSREDRDGATETQLAGDLWWYWMIRGFNGEGRANLAHALSRAGRDETPERARALMGAGALAYQQSDYDAARAFWNDALIVHRARQYKRGIAAALNNLGLMTRDQGDYPQAGAFLTEALALRREIGDAQGIAATLSNLAGLVANQGNLDEAQTLYEDCLALLTQNGDLYTRGVTLNNLGKLAFEQGDPARARAYFDESHAVQKQTGDQRGIAMSLVNLGNVAQAENDLDAARSQWGDALVLSRELGDRWVTAFALECLGGLAMEETDWDAANALYRESLTLRRAIGDAPGPANSLYRFGEMRARQNRLDDAVRFWAAADAQRHALGITLPLPPDAVALYERHVADARAALGDTAFDAAWAAGASLAPEQVVAKALQE